MYDSINKLHIYKLNLSSLLVLFCCHSLPLVFIRCSTRCQSLSFVATCCYLFLFVVSLAVPLVVIRCHSLSLVVTRYHSLSLVVQLVATHCHSLQQSLSFAVTRCTYHLSFSKQSIVTIVDALQKGDSIMNAINEWMKK